MTMPTIEELRVLQDRLRYMGQPYSENIFIEAANTLDAIIKEWEGTNPDWYNYRVNRSHDCFTRLRPPDDAYDTGTLVLLFTYPPNAAAQIAHQQSNIDNMRLQIDEQAAQIAKLTDDLAAMTECAKNHDSSRIELLAANAKLTAERDALRKVMHDDSYSNMQLDILVAGAIESLAK